MRRIKWSEVLAKKRAKDPDNWDAGVKAALDELIRMAEDDDNVSPGAAAALREAATILRRIAKRENKFVTTFEWKVLDFLEKQAARYDGEAGG